MKRWSPTGPRRQAQRHAPLAPLTHHPHFKLALICLVLAGLVVPVEVAFGGLQGHTLHEKLIAVVTIVAFVLFGAMGVRRTAVETGRAVRNRTDPAAGTTIEVIISVVGYLFIMLGTLDLLGIPTKNFLLGGVIISLSLSAALQQTLANIFNGVVLLLAHPFAVGDVIRLRGSFGGEVSGTVRTISLMHVVLETDEGVLRLPNSGVTAAAVGTIPPPLQGGTTTESR